MIPGRVRSVDPEEPDRSESVDDTRSNSLTAAERAALVDDHPTGSVHAGASFVGGELEADDIEDGARPPRRWLIAVIAAGTVAVIAGMIGSVFAFPVFTVATVVVEGTDQLDEAVVIAAAGVEEGENLVRIDTNAAARGVVALPRVREATVARALPDTLTIEVVERRVVAYLDDGEQPVLIDDRGEPFSDGAPPETAVRIDAVSKDDTETLADAVTVAGALPDVVAAAVDYLSVDSPSEYVLHLADGRTVLWGVPEDNDNKAIAVEALLGRGGSSWDVSNPQLITQR